MSRQLAKKSTSTLDDSESDPGFPEIIDERIDSQLCAGIVIIVDCRLVLMEIWRYVTCIDSASGLIEL